MSPEDAGEGPAGHRSTGVFVAVVGPSGAGKDTLMAHAARHADLDRRVCFARRIVTREAMAASEDHDSLDEAAFSRARADGAFCLSWSAHGLWYGLPRSIAADLGRGSVVVANLSRRSLQDAAVAFRTLEVVEVAAHPAILLARLLARGREGEAAIQARLKRQMPVALPAGTCGHLRIDNSGEVQEATGRFVHHLNGLSRRQALDG